ncbi:ACP phosphodiesterase [Sphingobacterium sp. LRF_L2]|uniref:ACP phosphodiesterase n=1 Tax=Sphingobacterium sp. LRF_L2 TaxID=3369421 RepID=UPI003F619BA1
MNFLSHYYFERYSLHSETVLGALLPDLLKNVDKQYNFHPQRFEELMFALPQTMHISEGWYRHLEVDKLFHSSPFFLDHCHVLRKQLDPIVHHLPIRASFLAHIAVELLLDHILLDQQLVNPARLYEHLAQVPDRVLEKYLRILGEVDIERFITFYRRFIEVKYIFDYSDISNLSRALFNICKRIWDFEYSSDDCVKLTACLRRYKASDLKNYLDIFHYIQGNLV